MNNELLVEAQNHSIKTHVQMVEEGHYGLPEFQRIFVWDETMVARFWDSLHRGFPVGQLMFWEPDLLDFPMRSLGREQRELSAKSKYAAIDGQQRLTAIWLVLKGEIPLRFDLEQQQFTYRQTKHSIGLDILRRKIVPEAVKSNYFFLSATGDQQESFAEPLHSLNATLTGRTIPSQTIKNADYATVVDVFKRLNKEGLPLSESQIALASISTKWSGVFRKTFDSLEKLNETVGFDWVGDPNFMIQAWTAVHTGQHLVKHLAPESSDGVRSKYAAMATAAAYSESWKKLEVGVDQLIAVLRDRLGIRSFQFIKAYNPLLVLLNFFAHHTDVPETDKARLTKWLVMAFAQSRYSVKGQTKLREDIKATGPGVGLSVLFTHRWEPLNPDAFTWDNDALDCETFKSGYSTLLYILMRKAGAVDWLRPEVKVGDDLRTAWHFHHIFPDATFGGERRQLQIRMEAAEQEQGESQKGEIENEISSLNNRVSSVSNLAFLTPESNQSIGDRLPSDYLAEICKQPGGEELLRAQFIPLDRELWKHGKFVQFCEARSRLITNAASALFAGAAISDSACGGAV